MVRIWFFVSSCDAEGTCILTFYGDGCFETAHASAYCGYIDLTVSALQVLTSDVVFSAPMTETYAMLGADPKETTTLELYLQEYYAQILKKLKDLKASSKQGDYYL